MEFRKRNEKYKEISKQRIETHHQVKKQLTWKEQKSCELNSEYQAVGLYISLTYGVNFFR